MYLALIVYHFVFVIYKIIVKWFGIVTYEKTTAWRRSCWSNSEESNKIGEIEVGEAVITTAGKLRAKHVIHAVGPQMGEGDEDDKLRNATLNSLMLANEYDLRSIAFPAISTGAFGYPKDKCQRS